MNDPILICGAGPAGLALANDLALEGADVVLIEQSDEKTLAEPPFDGREIALTHKSIATLRRLGAWERLPADAAHPLSRAKVYNGRSPFALGFAPGARSSANLGSMVSNCDIRRALFDSAATRPNIRLMTGVRVDRVSTDARIALATLDNGERLSGSLLVAADSRFSTIRGLLGIPARMHRLGKTMLVGRVALDRDHEGIATEWFDHGQTIAVLPLAHRVASAVVTLPDEQAAALADMDALALGAELTRRFGRRFGGMTMLTPMHRYPLTISYADRFVATRAALAGDAAVGMHPVTAHGFNLGLSGTTRLARLVGQALQQGGDAGASTLLRRYEIGHRAATWPLYTATNAIVGLYNDERRVGRIARRVGIGAARITPARHLISRMLMQPA
jgi:ubiquinone biosynthesis UbiH/UbiF/VisC/COQ6 family hydroxylase